jgi:hypothetical protein
MTLAEASTEGREVEEITLDVMLQAVHFLHEIPIPTLRALARLLHLYLEGCDGGKADRRLREGSDDANPGRSWILAANGWWYGA